MYNENEQSVLEMTEEQPAESAVEPAAEPSGDDLAGTLAQMQRLGKLLAPFAKVRATSPDALDALDRAVQKLPPGETFGHALDDVAAKLRSVVAEAKHARVEAFGPIEAEYIRAAREQDTPLHELNHGWRVGKLELELLRDRAQARFLYNREPLIKWSPVGSAEDLGQLEQRATGLLDKAAIPEGELPDLFWNTYQACTLRQKAGRGNPGMVPAPVFYVELRLERARRELEAGKGDRKLTQVEFPRWAFLYNLDRYRALGGSVPADRRLGFQTGSQSETSRFGVTLGGLDPRQEYKKVCYVIRAA